MSQKALARITLTISDELDEDFRKEISKRFPTRKGSMKEALEQAIQDWIDKGKKSRKE